MNHYLLVRYGEIHLKGLNRPYFEHQLVRRIKLALTGLEGVRVFHGQGRFYVAGYPLEREEDVARAVCRVFGVHSVSRAWAVEKDWDVMTEACAAFLKEKGLTQGAFKVDARRSDKSFPRNSMEINRDMGGEMLDRFPGLHVDLHDPDFILSVEVREETMIYSGEEMAAGGMPTGTGGKGALLLSGGIDSPVAGWLMAKRGMELEAVYFHSFPHTSERAKEKVADLARVLASYCGEVRLNVINYTAVQEYLYEKGPDEYLTILMRRSMMRIAQVIARRTGCQALITGETLGQVASQTIDALTVTDRIAEMPVFRPLIASDKMETVEIARRIGTFDISILPYEDCCTVFTPRHPVTRPKMDKVLEAEDRLTELEELERIAADTPELILAEPRTLTEM